jgi:hypothetical protein
MALLYTTMGEDAGGWAHPSAALPMAAFPFGTAAI